MDVNAPKSGDRHRNLAGGSAHRYDDPREALRSVVVNNLLENKYYESDEESFEKLLRRFDACVRSGTPEFPLQLAAYARQEMYVRDVPQILLVLAAHWPFERQNTTISGVDAEDVEGVVPGIDAPKDFVREYAPRIVDRADELCTVLAFNNVYQNGQPGPEMVDGEYVWPSVPYTIRRALAEVIESGKFDRYQFAKYRQDTRAVSLRDVFNVCHPWGYDTSPEPTDELSQIANQITKGERDAYPDVEPLRQRRTWEDEISAAGESDEGVTADDWRSVLDDMGLFARVRNVRNLLEAGIDAEEIFGDVTEEWVQNSKIYPFRFYQARKALGAGQSTWMGDHEPFDAHAYLEQFIDWSTDSIPDELENTLVVVDVSGSMSATLSRESTLRYDEIASLFGAVLARKGGTPIAFATNAKFVGVDPLNTSTLSLTDRIRGSSVGGSTHAHKALNLAIKRASKNDFDLWDRVVVLTDMQIWSRGFDDVNEFQRAWKTYRGVHDEEPYLYMVDLSSYGEIKLPEEYPNVYRIQGWNDKIVDFMKYAETSQVEEIAAGVTG